MSLLSNCLLTLSLPKCTVLKNTDYSDANKPVAPLDFAEQSLPRHSYLALEHKAHIPGCLLEVLTYLMKMLNVNEAQLLNFSLNLLFLQTSLSQ